jgi:protease II
VDVANTMLDESLPLKCNMDAGRGGASGRDEALREKPANTP